MPDGEILPFPTIRRAVSGRNTRISRRHRPERMLRNQNIHLQLARSARTPPSTGPILGAVFGLSDITIRILEEYLVDWHGANLSR